MVVVAAVNAIEARHFVTLSTVGNFSLFPLLFEARETNIKVVLVLWQLAVVMIALRNRKRNQYKALRTLEKLYLAAMIPVFILAEAIPHVPSLLKYEFLPLMIYSTYCSVGVLASYVVMFRHFMTK